MKKLTLLLALSTIGLGALCVVQWRKLAEQRVQTAALQGEAVEQSERVTSLEAAKDRAESQRRQLLDQTEELAAQLRARQMAESNAVVATPTNPPPATAEPAKGDKAGLGKVLAKMMEDPDTKKFIRDQQRVMLDQLYGPLVKQMGLNPEQAAGFKDLLADNMLKATEKASSLFGGSAVTNRAAAMETMSAEQKNFDDQLKAFLGDTRYALRAV
ncbi:MAG TPA: hypothetical protein VNZ64_01940 [Candidatus Acidoferrum sp.]|jgi:hypothetical protein|nr:hypothetical protein [Candidatus Acidoferrum sp.]